MIISVVDKIQRNERMAHQNSIPILQIHNKEENTAKKSHLLLPLDPQLAKTKFTSLKGN